jgi:hypothetical protein
MSDIKIRPAQIIGEDHAGRKRAYDKARYQAKKEETKARSRAWYAANASRARKTAAAWKKAHPERRRENNRRWALANPEKVKFSQSKYVANNKQEVIEMRKNWRARNRERRKTERREYMQNNPERAREYRRTRRIRKNQSPKGARKPIIEWEKRWRSKKRRLVSGVPRKSKSSIATPITSRRLQKVALIPSRTCAFRAPLVIMQKVQNHFPNGIRNSNNQSCYEN